MTLFLVLVLAHLIADFVMQTSYMNQEKRQFSSPMFSKWLLYHCMHHLVISFLLITIFLEWRHTYFVIVPLSSISHYFIDVAKLKWEKSVSSGTLMKQNRNRPWLDAYLNKKTPPFVIDQLLHLISILLVLYLFNEHFPVNELSQIFSVELYQTDSLLRLIVLIILFVLVTYPVAYFISVVMSDFDQKIAEPEVAATLDQESESIEKVKYHLDDLETDLMITESYQEEENKYSLKVQYQKYSQANENRRGRYIGILERLLIVILVVQSLYQGLALIIAMKTLTRFKQFDDKHFAEYYLIGTLLSLMIGIIFAELIKAIW